MVWEETFCIDCAGLSVSQDVYRRQKQEAEVMIVVLMGVTGSGKTTVGKVLANQLGLKFYDADEYHPAANIELQPELVCQDLANGRFA